MPMTPEDLEDLKAMLSVAKKRPVNFAICMGKKPEDTVFVIHRMKSPDILGRQAKKDGDTNKIGFGTIEVKGKKALLTCLEDVPAGIAKSTKKFLTLNKMALKITVLDASGAVVDDDGDDEEPGDDPTTGPLDGEDDVAPTSGDPGTGASTATEAEALLARLRKVAPKVRELVGTDPAQGNKLLGAIMSAQSSINAGDLGRAALLADAVERAANAPPPAPPMPEPKAPPKPLSPEDLEQLRSRIRQAFAALKDDLALFLKRGEPSLAGKAATLARAFASEIAGTDMQRAAAVVSTLKNFLAAHVPNLPPPSAAEQAADAVAAAKGRAAPAQRYEKAAAVQAKYPRGAVAARDAMDGFAAVLGDQPVTDDLILRAGADIAAVTAQLDAPKARLAKAEALPDGPDRTRLINEATRDIAAVNARIAAAKAFEKAARGKKALTDALTFGPLSPNSRQTFSDTASAALIAGFTRDPDLAGAALSAATTARYPDAVAGGLSKVIDLRETGFAGGGSKGYPDAFAGTYAKQLLQMGADSGPDYFARMDDYFASGRQMLRDPLGDAALTDMTRRAQVRSVAVAGKLLGPDGRIDPAGPDARNAIGDLLFNPHSLANPTPAMNEHVLKTVALFSDPLTGPKANGILAAMPKSPAKGAAALVRQSVGKGPSDPITARDAQTGVLASMLKPLDQGPVGSCFSTAPARRMRETQPLNAMQAYADIAGKGTYKPAFGPEVPAVTRIPVPEDPIMRSWEYSLATATARTANASEMKTFSERMDTALGDLAIDLTNILTDKATARGGLMGLGGGILQLAKHSGRKSSLKKDVTDAFEMVYDPTSTIVDANDGKSSTGRYVLRRKDTGAEITSEPDFLTAIQDVALRVAGIAPDAPEAEDVRDAVADPAFRNAIVGGGYKPWELTSGGQTTAATQTLFGKDMKQRDLIAKGPVTGDKGARTSEVLSSLVTGLLDSPDQMVTIRTVGMHGFNAMPNDPSLAVLKAGGKKKVAENLETHLLEPGRKLRDTAIPADHAGHLFDLAITDAAAAISDTAFRDRFLKAITGRPVAPMTPAQIKAAADAAIDRTAHLFGDPAGATATLRARAEAGAQNAMIRELGAPEFMLADSNWGSSTDHTYFVVIPDPITGEPAMWEKTVPPGRLTPSDRNWTDAQWAAIR